MATETLRVLAKKGTLVLDYSYALASKQRRYVGRTTIRSETRDGLPTDCFTQEWDHQEFTGVQPWFEAHQRKTTPTVVTNDDTHGEGAYYRARVAEGGLWPADEETAKACGVQFDANFGGEYPSLATSTTKGSK